MLAWNLNYIYIIKKEEKKIKCITVDNIFITSSLHPTSIVRKYI